MQFCFHLLRTKFRWKRADFSFFCILPIDIYRSKSIHCWALWCDDMMNWYQWYLWFLWNCSHSIVVVIVVYQFQAPLKITILDMRSGVTNRVFRIGNVCVSVCAPNYDWFSISFSMIPWRKKIETFLFLSIPPQ